jgi:thiol-disulfide isomerase/thioredoxin
MQPRTLLTTFLAVLLAVAVLYGIGYGPVHAGPRMPTPLSALSRAPTVPQTPFEDPTGGEHRIADFKGHYVLLNLWATWCAPCVSELPALTKLQAAVPGLKVVAVDVGHDKSDVAEAFLKSHHVAELGTYVDRDLALLHAFGAYGLPTTVLIDPKGKQLAKAEGPGEWASPASIAYFKALTKG